MKKFLVLFLVLALFIPAVAHAKIKFHGQLDVMGGDWLWENMGPAFDNAYSYTNTRFLIGANFDLEKNIEANVSLLYANSWGSDYISGEPLNNSTDTGFLNRIRISEANIVFKNLFDNDRFTLKLGKFYYGEKGDTIFYAGLRDMAQWGYEYSTVYNYSAYNSGVDGFQLTYNTKENFKIDLVYSKISSESNNESLNTKINMVIIDAKYKINDNMKIKGYIYDSESTNNISTIITYARRSEIIGVKPEFSVNNITLSGEIAQQYISYKSRLFDETPEDELLTKLNVSYLLNISKNMKLLPRIQYLRAGSGFFTQLSDANFGLASTTLLVNRWKLWDIESYNIGADWSITKFKISADYYKNSKADGGSQYSEYNLVAEYNYTKKVTFYAGYAYMDKYYDIGADYNTYAIFGASYKF